jgi:hypothetical protein
MSKINWSTVSDEIMKRVDAGTLVKSHANGGDEPDGILMPKNEERVHRLLVLVHWFEDNEPITRPASCLQYFVNGQWRSFNEVMSYDAS